MTMQSPQNASSRAPRTIAVLVLVVLILVAGAIFIIQRQKSDTPPSDVSALSNLPDDFDIESLRANKVEYDIGGTRIIDGIVEEAAETLEFPKTTGQITLYVDVVFPFTGDAEYNMIIEAYHGEKLFKVWIPPQYLAEGSIPLNLDGKTFGPGKYRIEIVEQDSDSVIVSIAESMFEVLE